MAEQPRQELLAHAREQYGRLFKEYDNPSRALEVWFQYLEDMFSYGLLTEGQDVARGTNTVGELEQGLDALLQKFELDRFKPQVV